MKKPAFCILENKGADQMCGVHAAIQPFCFLLYRNGTIPQLPKSEISSLVPSSVVQPCLCWTWSETPKKGFVATQPN